MADMHINSKRGWESKWTPEEDDTIREFYPKNGWEKIKSLLPHRDKTGIQRRASNLGVKYLSYNKDYFNVIDTEEKAYWLGFLYTDGYVTTDNRWGIELGVIDLEHLQKLANDFNYNGNIKTRERNGVSSCSIQIKNKQMYESLVDKGVLRNKTEILKFPSEEQVPKRLLSHFIRGLFDGDGSFTFYEYEAPRTDKGGKICKRISKEISFVCKSQDFIENLQKFLLCQGIESRLETNSRRDLPTLRISNVENMVKLINFLYEYAITHLDRKYNKAQEIIGYCLS